MSRVRRLEGTRVIITGAGHGLGRAYALELARRGARIALLDVDEEAVETTAADIRQADGEAATFLVDVADRVAVEKAVAETARLLDGLDVVIPNAGTIHTTAGILETDDADWDRTFAVHVSGSRNLIRAAIPWIERSAAPRVIVVSSLWAQCGPGFGYAYCAAKGALLAFARNLAVELGPRGIAVNSILPGFFPTRMAADYGPREVEEECSKIPLGRWGTLGEAANLVAFLASAESGYITGQSIAINGGQVIAGY